MKNNHQILDRTSFLEGMATRRLLLINSLMAVIYLLVITFAFKHGNIVLFSLLILGEIYHLFQIIGYVYTVRSHTPKFKFDAGFNQPVDVFITVAGEPVEIVRETAQAAIGMDYPNHNVYLLNDGFVAKRDNWKDIDNLAKELGITSITRRVPGGAKAGNINNALRHTFSPYVVVFDADHVPHKNFLSETMGYFADSKMGFVQTPQFYKNQDQNMITRTAWDQQTLFFGPIMKGKNQTNSAFMCGTNMALSRKMLEEVGGMCEFNIAEDFLTSLFAHQKGWNSVYVPKVLAEGLAPEDFLSYYKQQFRWTRGSLEVIFKYNPFFMRGLTMKQRFQYVISASYYLSGVVVLIDAMLPVIFLFTGLTAITTSTMALAMIFIPYIFLNLYTLQKTANFSYAFSAVAFSISSFYLQLKAIGAVLTNQKTSFAVTSKQQIKGNFLYLVIPQIIYLILIVVGVGVALIREGFSASLIANLAWALVNAACFVVFIRAAAPETLSWSMLIPKRNKSSVPAPLVVRTPPVVQRPAMSREIRSEVHVN